MMSEILVAVVKGMSKKILWDHCLVAKISHHACKNTEISNN